MSMMDDREKGFETKFSRDQELGFRVQARRDKLFGLWAANEMGMSSEMAETYAKDVVMKDIDEPGPQIILDMVLADMQAKDCEISEHLLQKKLDELGDEATTQIQNAG